MGMSFVLCKPISGLSPIGTKGPEGTFRPFNPAGVLRRRLLHRNGTFVPPAPPTRTRWRVKTDFLRKTGHSGPFFSSIRTIPRGRTSEISVPSQPSIRFFPPVARIGPFCPFWGSPGQNAFWETAKIGRRPLGETTLRGRFCKNPENSNGWNERNFGAVAAVYPVFHVGGPKRAILALFWAPGGPGPIRKRQFGRHAKTTAENGSNPVRLLKCHVRREKE